VEESLRKINTQGRSKGKKEVYKKKCLTNRHKKKLYPSGKAAKGREGGAPNRKGGHLSGAIGGLNPKRVAGTHLEKNLEVRCTSGSNEKETQVAKRSHQKKSEQGGNSESTDRWFFPHHERGGVGKECPAKLIQPNQKGVWNVYSRKRQPVLKLERGQKKRNGELQQGNKTTQPGNSGITIPNGQKKKRKTTTQRKRPQKKVGTRT